MKRITFWVLLTLLCLLPLFAVAENEPLFNAIDGETGKWGYINRAGEWVIPPQFDGAYPFYGDYAVAAMRPTEDAPPDQWGRWLDREGVIDREGNWVLPPAYFIDTRYTYDDFDGLWVVTSIDDFTTDLDEDGNEILVESLEGFFDVETGYFSGLKWFSVCGWYKGSALVAVADASLRVGYADRTTGELVIPCLYYAIWPGRFSEGVVVTALLDENFEPSEFFMMDETGAMIQLPDNLMVEEDYEASEGLMRVRDRETGLIGFVDLQGHPVIAPKFAWAENFEDGYSAVRFPEGDWGYIDRAGTVIHRGIVYDSEYFGPDRENGVYVLQTGDSEWSAFTITGDRLFSIRRENLVALYAPEDNGLCWFATDPSGDARHWSQHHRFGLVDISGNVVSEAVWERADVDAGRFPEGLQPVTQRIDGQRKWGYLNEQGELALPLIYDAAYNFYDGLAYAETGGLCGYIDHDGNFVYAWNEE